MEKVRGVPFADVANEMDLNKLCKIVDRLAGYQKDWASLSFNGYCSLYYALSLKKPHRALQYVKNGVSIASSRFAIGLCVGRYWMYDGRSAIDIDRGPWTSVEEHQTAVDERELKSVSSLPLPKSLTGLYGPGTYIPSREKKLEAANWYLKIVKYLLPMDETLTKSHLHHSDLHAGNIIVDHRDHPKFKGIID